MCVCVGGDGGVRQTQFIRARSGDTLRRCLSVWTQTNTAAQINKTHTDLWSWCLSHAVKVHFCTILCISFDKVHLEVLINCIKPSQAKLDEYDIFFTFKKKKNLILKVNLKLYRFKSYQNLMSAILSHLLKRHLLYTQTHHKFVWTTSYNRNNYLIKSGVASMAGIHTHTHTHTHMHMLSWSVCLSLSYSSHLLFPAASLCRLLFGEAGKKLWINVPPASIISPLTTTHT